MASAALLLLLLFLLVFLLLLSADSVRGGVAVTGDLAVESFTGGAPAAPSHVKTLLDVPEAGAVQGNTSGGLFLRLSWQASGGRSAGAKRYWHRTLTPPQARFGSFEAWLDAFMYTLKRDTIFNVAKIGGLILLYYFAPEVFTWVSGTLG
ncbi:hypothetical protein E2C01_013966 [Portunus trituberculatus]|uniref:Uncharacterized protein n=1 Tax=Portunus trituberculatus TaxID=210409 RepID=A0A5B7DIM0_PORTR|nr:hypothetical protein [Portunus trituberculatus]